MGVESDKRVHGRTLQEWQAWVSREVERVTQLRLEDLPDQDFYDDWESGEEPEAAARQYLRAMGMMEDEEAKGG